MQPHPLPIPCCPGPTSLLLPGVRKEQRVSAPRPKSPWGAACAGHASVALGLGRAHPAGCPFPAEPLPPCPPLRSPAGSVRPAACCLVNLCALQLVNE